MRTMPAQARPARSLAIAEVELGALALVLDGVLIGRVARFPPLDKLAASMLPVATVTSRAVVGIPLRGLEDDLATGVLPMAARAGPARL
tara:strand:- start:252 stop:518 length:267 start_codon:yes stop_codon:yes gene_type:complete